MSRTALKPLEHTLGCGCLCSCSSFSFYHLAWSFRFFCRSPPFVLSPSSLAGHIGNPAFSKVFGLYAVYAIKSSMLQGNESHLAVESAVGNSKESFPFSEPIRERRRSMTCVPGNSSLVCTLQRGLYCIRFLEPFDFQESVLFRFA